MKDCCSARSVSKTIYASLFELNLEDESKNGG
jgi:hypothetical protein